MNGLQIINVIFILLVITIIIYTILKKEKTKDKVNISNKIYFLLIAIIGIIAITTRIYKFGEYPNIHVDEAGMGYDAYCLANYGVDRYLNKYPVYLINYGSGQSALYTYLAVIFIKIFGLSLTIIRLPSLILSLIAIIFTYKLIRIYKGRKFSLCMIFLLSICPWHIMQSRWGLDCNLMSSMMIISIYSLIKSRKNMNYILSGILFGLTLYTYALSYIIVPIFLLLILAELIITKEINIKNIVCLSIPLLIISLPLILTVLHNAGILENINLKYITIPKLISYRGNEINLGYLLFNIKGNILNKIFIYDTMAYNSIINFGPLYYFSIPLLIYGFILAVKKELKKQEKVTINFIMK